MPDFLMNASRGLPLVLVMLALLGFRWRVTPRVSLFIAAPPEKVFPYIDFVEGDLQRWQRTKVKCELVEPASNTYKLSFVTPLATGAVSSSSALFRVARREAPSLLEIERAGLEGRALNSELLSMRATLTPEGSGTRLRMAYGWGPRPLLSQILARTDLWGSAYRLKGLAETGKPDYRTDSLLAIAVAAVTGAVTLVTFAWAFSWLVAFLMVGALFVHEFGHLLAYRLIGQPWGRMLFLPFLGAIAVPRLGFTTQGQSVFSAIMGPAFSIVVPIICALAVWWGVGESQKVFVLVGLVVAALNLFNLLPVEPLDGGVVLRSVFGWLLGRYARFGLMAVGGLILVAGFAFEQVLLVVFGALAVFANLPRRRIDAGLEPMSSLQISISTFGFVATVSAYVVLFEFFVQKAALG